MQDIFTLDEYVEEVFRDLELKEYRTEHIEFDGCTFINIDFHKSSFSHCQFIECKFEGCDLSLISLKGSVLNDVEFKECKLVGVNFSELSAPVGVNFYDSNLKLSSFYNLELQHMKMINCSVQEVDFVQSNLEKSCFHGSDLYQAHFEGTNLSLCDLSQAINYLIDPSKNLLKKTKVSTNEATSFLQFLDLKIID